MSENYVVEMVNLQMAVYTKRGGLLATKDLVSLFNSGGDFVSDPKVQYDPASGRWFATLTDVGTTRVLLAVSAAPDPTGSWRLFNIPGSAAGDCLDQPILGVGTSTVIVSVNVFTHTSPTSCTAPFLGAEYWVINKNDLVTGASSPAIYDSGLNLFESSIHPVQVDGSSPSHYMVSTYWPGTATTSNTLHLFTVNGTPPNAVTVKVTALAMPTAAVPPSASQLGTKSTVDTGDIRVSDAVSSSGIVWLGFDEACLAHSSRACIRLVEIDASLGTILQDFDIDVAGLHVFYPALRVDGVGNLAVAFGYSSATSYPGIMTSGRLSGDPLNTLLPAEIAAAGTGPEQGFCTRSVCRYGDYFGAAADPVNTSAVWFVGEMGTSSGWSTHIFSVVVNAELTFAYRVLGGGTGYSPPVVDYVLAGVPTQVTLISGPTTIVADAGSEWTISSQLAGSSVIRGEIWALNASSGIPRDHGWANTSSTPPMVFTYFHQYEVSLGFHVVGGGSYATGPEVATIVFGVASTLAAPVKTFLDAGSSYGYPALLAGSSSAERWFTSPSSNGTVSGASAVDAAYYHQVLMRFEYTVQGTIPSSIPQVHFSYLGAARSPALNVTTWADAQLPYAYDPALRGATASARWGAGANGNGTVTTAQTISVLYREQFLVTVVTDPASLASLVTGAGWHDAGSSATIGTAALAGWRLDHWSGDATGTASEITLSVQRPLNLTAVLDAGLTITAGGGGSIVYAYGSTSGTVPGGSSVTVYVPVGTVVKLTATSGSWSQEFGGWSGAASGTSPSTTVQVSAPGTVVASFAFSIALTGGVSLLVVAVVLGIVGVLLVRRRRKRPRA